MTYRDRREAKAERLRGWADSRDAKATVALAGAKQLSDMIPFGQPILVGHHSEGRARRDADRIHNGFSNGFAHQAKAEAMRDKADNIERAAAHAVYSDDEDAIPRLRERLTGLEAERDRIKAYNSSCRKGTPELGLLDEKQRASLESVRQHSAYSLGPNGAMPAYALSNLSGNIGRQRKRLENIERAS